MSFTCVFCGLFCVRVMATLSSDSSDSRLPIIRRGEGSMEETYDESFADEREYHDDNHSLSSDMYCNHTRKDIYLYSLQAPFMNASLTLIRLVYHDETCKQLTPMEEGEVEDERRGGAWQSPRRVFLCPTSLGELE